MSLVSIVMRRDIQVFYLQYEKQSNLITTGNYNRKSVVGEILKGLLNKVKLYYNWYDINSDDYILNVVKMPN